MGRFTYRDYPGVRRPYVAPEGTVTRMVAQIAAHTGIAPSELLALNSTMLLTIIEVMAGEK